MEKIVIFTNPNCGYCNQVKVTLKERGVDYTEKITDNFQKEWNQVMYLTGMGITPTISFKGSYFIPGRDFNNPTQLVEMLNHFETLTNDSDTLIIERTKTLNHNIVTALRDLDRIIKDINKKLN